ncbi:hypothetical protein [Leptospirillum ferriphilum]|uniref:ArsR family transcriptional regulator n=1 Tax=Leptospirillum ferriphilum (strain ML-04) TaxID=1048260 RepID=J9ZDG6_LEPFM|nr:hypothetical protein [Leptospirillum ferriphilum]AFS53858.1 hypothetical protein LFML04_1656 [Leptospirillum ferriphilum ML-04]
MGWIADLLKEIPSAAKFKADLEDMEKENKNLKEKNQDLMRKLNLAERELEKEKSFTNKLDPLADEVLRFLISVDEAQASQIASRLNKSKVIIEMHLSDLNEREHIGVRHVLSEEPIYFLKQKGRKYLHANGFI